MHGSVTTGSVFDKHGSHATCFSLADWLLLGALWGLLQPPPWTHSKRKWEAAGVGNGKREFSKHFSLSREEIQGPLRTFQGFATKMAFWKFRVESWGVSVHVS